MFSDTLVLIPAREGSKGVPLKNIKLLGGKPLIHYTIDIAKQFFPAENICVSTDGELTRSLVEEAGLHVPFLRPADLATDTAGSYEVMLHALDHYERTGRRFDKLLLLQPTSPFRNGEHFTDIFKLYEPGIEMVVSVGVSPYNPYFSLFEQDQDGYLVKSKQGNFERRQDCPEVYYYNGSMYLVNVSSLREKKLSAFVRIKKMVMEERYCVDIDTPMDWLFCETLLEKGIYDEIR